MEHILFWYREESIQLCMLAVLVLQFRPRNVFINPYMSSLGWLNVAIHTDSLRPHVISNLLVYVLYT